VAILDEVRAGSVSDRSVEAMINGVFQSGVDGVLGQSWLVRHDYLLDYHNRRIALDVPATGSGVRVHLRSPDGRLAVAASIDGRERELVVDSGSSAVVLYEAPALDGSRATRLQANGGEARAQNCTVHSSLAGTRDRLMDAVRIDVHGLGPGLLPASAFASVFVSNREGFVEFSRQAAALGSGWRDCVRMVGYPSTTFWGSAVTDSGRMRRDSFPIHTGRQLAPTWTSVGLFPRRQTRAS
jgi:hypothetical protein